MRHDPSSGLRPPSPRKRGEGLPALPLAPLAGRVWHAAPGEGRCIAALFVFFLTLTAHAQLTTTALTGRVFSGEAPAAGVTVNVTSPALQQPRSATTNADGFYFIDALPPGTYEVSFSRTGLSSLIRPALLELGRIARADAHLEVNADEDSVTSTILPVSVVDETEPTSHFDEGDLERLPLPSPISAAVLAPGRIDGPVLVDDVEAEGFIGYETVEQLTVFRGERSLVVARTHAGGEQISLALRDTYFQHEGHVFETASGGRIIAEKLWFFAGGWGGIEDGFNIKLTAQPHAAHNLTATWLDANDESNLGLRYTGVFTERLVGEVLASEESAARVSYVLGNHVLAANVGEDEWLVSDRWSHRRLVVDAGARHKDGDTSWRAGAIYDIRGNGRQALTASAGEELVSAGFLGAIGSTGVARVDWLRRDETGEDELQLDVRYSLFNRLFTGGSYTYVDTDAHRGNAWVSAQLPIGEHEITMTLLERHERDAWASDFALRYAIPVRSVRLTVGGDITNTFASDVLEPRSWRVFARAHL